MRRQKFAIIVLALCWLSVPAAFAEYFDVPSTHPHATAIQWLTSEGIVEGNPDGNFRPQSHLNRAEFAKILAAPGIIDAVSMQSCMENARQKKVSLLYDVNLDAWYASEVCVLVQKGIIQGYSDGTFRAGNPVTFAEAAALLARQWKGTLDPSTPWYRSAVNVLAENRAIPLSISTFDQKLTRGEAAEILYRLRSGAQSNESLSFDDIALGRDPHLFPHLPVKWYTQSDINALPKSRPLSPPDCMPLYFSPKDISSKTTASGTIHTIRKNGRSYSIDIGDTGAMDDHFSFREYTIHDALCQSKALLVLKDGKWHGLYTHVLYGQRDKFYELDGWSYDKASQRLLLHNIVLEKGTWLEKLRIIDLPTKQSRQLPLDLCFIHSSLLPNGLISGGYMEPKANAPTVQCLATIDGQLIFKMHPKNVLGSSMGMFFMPGINDVGLMIDINSYVLAENNVIVRESPERHRLLILDMTGKKRWATFLFPTGADPGGFDMTDGNFDPEYDLSKFSWDAPKIRYRVKHYDAGNCCIGPWQWSEWKDMTFERVFNR